MDGAVRLSHSVPGIAGQEHGDFAEWQHVLPGMTAIRIAEGYPGGNRLPPQPALGGVPEAIRRPPPISHGHKEFRCIPRFRVTSLLILRPDKPRLRRHACSTGIYSICGCPIQIQNLPKSSPERPGR